LLQGRADALSPWVGNAEQTLSPVQVSPFVAYGVEAGLRYSDPSAIEERLKAAAREFCAMLPRINERTTIPFNRMAEWGPDGRLKPDAKVYSPFVRRKPRLDIE
jgi:NAD(P)H dehydrogenase (quinone)